jgi:hypothetical protein
MQFLFLYLYSVHLQCSSTCALPLTRTGADFTSYPFSTQNEQDFANLLSVYLDAVFNPLLNPLDFMQEGHRLALGTSSGGGGEERERGESVIQVQAT